jgi:hypothetical protein
MKSLPLFLALAAAPLFGADAPLPDFNSTTIGHPPLSLSEVGKPSAKPHSFSSTLPTLDELTRDGFLTPGKRPALPRASAPRFAPKSGPWNMPVLAPNPDIDYKIVVKAPDPRIDFKMLVQPPVSDVASAK